MEPEDFFKYMHETEILRERKEILYTFGDMTLQYVLAVEHTMQDRVLVKKGHVLVRKPLIVLVGQTLEGFDLNEGFSETIPRQVNSILRSMGIPYSCLTNRIFSDDILEYGKLKDVLAKLNIKMDELGDTETGLIKAVRGGEEAALVKYCAQLIARSCPENAREFLDHLNRQKIAPIRPDERVTNEDIRRLFG